MSNAEKKSAQMKIVENSDDESDQNDDIFIVECGKIDASVNSIDTRIHCAIGGVSVAMLIDSGSKVNVIPKIEWEMLKLNGVVTKSRTKCDDKCLSGYGGHGLKLMGKFLSEIVISNRADFFVVNEAGKALLGLDTAVKLGVLKLGVDINKIELPKQDKIGKLKGVQVKLNICDEIKPVRQPYRRIPISLQEKVESKINQLLREDIIESVSDSSWVSPLVVVPQNKGQDVRLCVDMRMANKAIVREYKVLPTFDDVVHKLTDSKFFSKLDIKNAFHQIEIEPASRYITTFITHIGLFQYKRLMFGMNCAPEVFSRIISNLLAKCAGCENYIDDILIYGRTKEEHDSRLNKVLFTLNSSGLTLNSETCVLGVESLKFMGHFLTKSGFKPANDKIEAIKAFRKPRSQEEVRSFIGLVNYVGRFVPHLATKTDLLRQLVKKDTKFVWTPAHTKAFNELKCVLSSDSILSYFNPKDKTCVIADASPVELGAVLIQFGDNIPRDISYANKGLWDTEKKYSQIEKEALALVWAVKRFEMYVRGIKFDLITDHKPLEFLFGTKSKPCARIERWVLRLQSFEYTIKYQPGKTNIADPLSRLCVLDCSEFDIGTEAYVRAIVDADVPVSLKLIEISNECEIDGEMIALRKAILDSDWSHVDRQYLLFKDEYCLFDNIVLKRDKIVMPSKLRTRTLRLAHEGHPGIAVMKRRLRSKIWWPKMDRRAESFVSSCESCLLVSKVNNPVPLHVRKLPSAPSTITVGTR